MKIEPFRLSEFFLSRLGMKGTFPLRARFLLLRAVSICWIAMFANTGLAFDYLGEDKAKDGAMSARFDALEAMRQTVKPPILPSLPELKMEQVQPPTGSTLYKQAYSLSDGCKVFSIKDGSVITVAARWKGEPCKQGFVSGKGELHVVIKYTGDNGKIAYTYKIYEGSFATSTAVVLHSI